MRLRSENAMDSDPVSKVAEKKPVRDAGVLDPPVDSPSADSNAPTMKELNIFGFRFHPTVFVVHLNICIYAACFFIQTGCLPYLSKKLGVDPVVFGYLQTVFAAVQLAGGPIFGRFGDLYGGQAALSLSFLSAALTYGIMAVSVNIPLLFLSRAPSIFMHSMQAGQMVVTDVSSSDKRADALGKLGLSYGIGMVIGPVVGGLLTTHFSEEFAAAVACAGSVISIVLCRLFIPAHTKRSQVTEKDKSPATVFNMRKFVSLLSSRRATMLLMVKAVAGVPIGVFQSMFSVIAMDTFHLAADQNGYIMSYIGVLTMITQGVGIGFLLKSMSEMAVIKLSIFILVWSYLLLAFVTTVVQLCLVMIPLCVGLTLLSVIISSALTHTVSDADTGAMLGLNMAVNSLIRTVSPTIGGFMLAAYGFPVFGYLGCFNNLLIAMTLFISRVK